MKMIFTFQLGIFFFTGLVALGFQIICHRYFSYLIGGDALAFSLIVTLFLAGLGVGAYSTQTLKRIKPSSWTDLNFVGAIEILIGILGFIISQSFEFIYNLDLPIAIKAIPIALTMLLMTISMGAGFNILNHRWIESSSFKKVRLYYAINNLGALFGCLITSLILVNTLGLLFSSLLLSVFSILAGSLLLILKEPPKIISKPIKRKLIELSTEESLEIPLSPSQRGLIAFFSGVFFVTIESLLYRLLKLSIGPTYYLNALVVGSALFAIAASNLIWSSTFSLNRLFKWIFVAGANLTALWFTSPWWPQFFVYLKTQLSVEKEGLYLFIGITFMLLTLSTLALYAPLSRLFTLAIGAIRPTENISKQIGNVYLFNILGSLIGGIVLSSCLLLFVNIPEVILILIIFLALTAATINPKRISQVTAMIFFTALLLVVLVFPADRTSHLIGVSMNKSLDHWTWQLPILPSNQKIVSFDDGIHSTVSVLEGPDFKSLFIDNKSDGNSQVDLSTMANLALIPYFYHQGSQLNTAVVGLGTGITAGVLAKGEQVQTVDVLELTSEVIKAARFFEEENLQALTNQKVNIIQQDALPFFQSSSSSAKYDIVVAEPSNPWVSGNENLFTEEIFSAYKKSLKPRGMLAQWLHLYSLDMRMFITVLKNIKKSFSNVEVYGIGTGDILFLASNDPLPSSIFPNKHNEPALQKTLDEIGWKEYSYISLQRILSTTATQKIVELSKETLHNLENPTLSYLGSLARHKRVQINTLDFTPREVIRNFQSPSQSATVYERLLQNINDCQMETARYNYFCQRALQLQPYYEIYKSTSTPLAQRVAAYSLLIDEGLTQSQTSFLDAAFDNLKSNNYKDLALAKVLLEEYAKDRNQGKVQTIMQELSRSPDTPKVFIANAEAMLKNIFFLQKNWLR